MHNLFLTGFMGAGKSTVGKILAKKMDWAFVDTDRLLEEKTGKTITEQFVDDQEEFRQAECDIVSEVIQNQKQVVALGGGALVKGSSRLKVLGEGQLIYLKTSVQTLLDRLKNAREVRPLLEGQKDKEKFITELLKDRENVYMSAHITISTDGKTPEAIAHEIMMTVGGKRL